MPRNPINSSGPGARAPSRPPRRPAGFPPAGRSPEGGALETRWSVANPDAHLVPDCKVSVGGKKLEGEQDARLTKVEVDLDVDLFGQCALVFNDPKLALINGPDFKAGAQVKVEIGHGSKLGKVFEGEVVALEPQFRRDLPPSLRVVCQESIHRLALKTSARGLMEVDSKESASKIAQEHGLTAEAPSGCKEHVLQANVSDSTLLRRVAATSGNHLRNEGNKLIIGPPPKGEQITVAPGDGLKKMRVRIKAAGQVGEVTIHGWDPKAKREIVGKAKGEGETGEGSKKHGGSATLAFAGDEHMPAEIGRASCRGKSVDLGGRRIIKKKKKKKKRRNKKKKKKKKKNAKNITNQNTK